MPLAYDSSGIEVRWRKQGENEYLQSEVDGRKRLGTKDRSGGYFELLNATIQDSGIYHCVVMRQGKISGEGTGSDLTVYVLPTPLKLFSRTPGNSSSAAPTLVCETAEFHPSDLTLAWYKNGTAAKTEIRTIKQQNTEGLYKVSSSLRVTQSEVNGTVYICLVSHISLRTPAIAIHAVPKSYPEFHDKFLYLWVSGCAVGGFVILVFIIIIGMRCISINKRKHGKTAGHEDLGEEKKTLTYAAVDTSKSKRKRSQKGEEETPYAQVKQGAVREGLTYATVEVSEPGKAGKFKTRNKTTEYAELQRATP
ncbi:tyrosine-protein phosphatase non-receptor type substrate 1-like [Pristis pectinata]|uniref:tyrosine-protein phosphatase non-receptor type substrate 1-like n=1 Tax=Pristis pectinata TaxID=685728 RepID=UPI00223D850B|nr:tyrosine-protein phosphatase non-receptor type substrate 1-like [Pristis pectinata]